MEGKDANILIQKECKKTLKGETTLPVTMSQAENPEMVEVARSVIVLCLGDTFLRDVAKETTAEAVWEKLESLYLTKSLAHMQFLKQ